MKNKERLDYLKKAIEEGRVICAGERLILEKKTIQGHSEVMVLCILLRDASGVLWLSTPQGIPVIELDKEYEEFLNEKTKEVFFKHFDSLLGQASGKIIT